MAGNVMNMAQVEKEQRYQHGYVTIIKENTKDNVITEYPVEENFVTPIGRQLDNNMGPGRLLSVGGDLWGLTHVRQGMTTIGYADNYGSPCAVAGEQDKEMTLVLLNLGSNINSIDENTSSIYVHANDGTVRAAKIVGYANGNITPASDGKEGILDLTKSEYVANKFYQVNRWVFDTDVAVGTIDAVAMMPASVVKYLGEVGISAWMCVDRGNMQDINFTDRTTKFCPPGIAGFTGNNGVLLNYNHNSKNRHKLDLSTFDMIDLDVSEPWFEMPHNAMDWIEIDNYIYVLTKSITENYSSIDVYVYNKATMTQQATFAVSYNDDRFNTKQRIKCSFLYKGGILYITNAAHSGGTTDRYYTLTKGAKAYFSAKSGNAATTYAGFLTIPSFIDDEKRVAIGHFGNKYILYLVDYPSRNGDTNSGYTCTAYVFTDLDNIAGSMEQNKIFFNISPFTLKYNTPTRAGFMRIGMAPHLSNTNTGYGYYDNLVGNKRLINNTNTGGLDILMHSSGLWISDESEHGNCYSIRVLSEPVTKGASDKLYVSYGYQR